MAIQLHLDTPGHLVGRARTAEVPRPSIQIPHTVCTNRGEVTVNRTRHQGYRTGIVSIGSFNLCWYGIFTYIDSKPTTCGKYGSPISRVWVWDWNSYVHVRPQCRYCNYVRVSWMVWDLLVMVHIRTSRLLGEMYQTTSVWSESFSYPMDSKVDSTTLGWDFCAVRLASASKHCTPG